MIWLLVGFAALAALTVVTAWEGLPGVIGGSLPALLARWYLARARRLASKLSQRRSR